MCPLSSLVVPDALLCILVIFYYDIPPPCPDCSLNAMRIHRIYAAIFPRCPFPCLVQLS